MVVVGVPWEQSYYHQTKRVLVQDYTPCDRARLSGGANLAIASCMLAGLVASSLAAPLLFRTVAELCFAASAYAILVFAWNLRAFTADDFAITVARVLALAAVLEFLRTLSMPGIDLIPNSAPGTDLQFGIAAGIVLAAGFVVAPFVLGRRVNEPLVVGSVLCAGAALVAGIVWLNFFPAVLAPAGTLTAFARLSPLVSGVVLLGGLALLHARRTGLPHNTGRALTFALLVMAGWQFSQSAFPEATRLQMIVGQTLMITSAYLLYRAIAKTELSVPVGLLIEHLKKGKETSEQHYHALFEQVPVGVAVFAARGRLTDCNEGFAQLASATREELLDAGGDLLSDRRIMPAIESALAGKQGEYEGPFNAVGRGPDKWVSLRSRPLIDTVGDPEGCITVVTDMTEDKRSEELIERLAFTDELTGLANRALLKDRLRQAIATAKRSRWQVAVASVNLDRFKSVNDGFGIAVGDSLLQGVSARLTSLLRASDTVCRSGGDQFIVLLPDIEHAADVVVAADKICESFQQPWSIDGHEFHTSASVGVAVYPGDSLDTETLIEQAQTAMRRAKTEGGSGCQFYALSMNEQASDHIAMETALHRALDHAATCPSAGDHQLVVHYQPQVELGTGVIVGVEALVRWQHPEFGLLPPQRFIPLAEETGLIARLDGHVLRQACRQACTWPQILGRPFRLAVNLSARQFQRADLLQVVEAALSESGLPAECLELEITETVAMARSGQTAHILSRLQNAGVSIALDDFGTGYSSLSHLRDLPIDRLKVDCSFVSSLEDDPGAAAIVRAVLGMGEALGIEVLAEGVETRAQADHLLAAGCCEAQGFLFARPLSSKDCEQALRDGAVSAVVD